MRLLARPHLTAWVIISVGAALRIVRYVQGRSLWLDEVFLANNILHRNWSGLLQPLDYRQGAPVLFLWLEKLAVTVCGTSEWALRSVSLLAGIVALPLMWWVGRRIVGTTPALIALALLALVEPAIDYSSEVKQYGSDLMTMLLVTLALLCLDERPMQWRRWIGVAGVLVVAIFLSHPAVFAIAGVGGALVLARAFRRDWRYARSIAMVCVISATAFLLNYILFLRPLATDPSLHDHWSNGFVPHSASALAWLVQAYAGMFTGYETMWLDGGPIDGRWFRIGWLAAAVSLLGWIWLCRRDARLFGVLIGPIFVTLLASAVRGYAFEGRLVHFLVPPMLLAFAAGVWWLWEMMRGVGRAIPALVLLIVLVPTLSHAARRAVHPPGREEIRPVLAWVSENIRAGDVIYVYHAADAPVLYYRERYGLASHPLIVGTRTDADPDAFARDAARLRGRGRAWIIISHAWAGEDELLMASLSSAGGVLLDSIHATGASGHLFRFE